MPVACPIEGRTCDHVVDDHNIVVNCGSFLYFGDTISVSGACELATITREIAVWGKFRKFLPILLCKTLFNFLLYYTWKGLLYMS